MRDMNPVKATVRTAALAGNPNAGKTSLFNLLTGTRQQVGNWPGVTVEKKEGWCRDLPDCQVIDLPGIYSLAARSPEERIAVTYLLEHPPEAVLNVVDASNLERHLYFTSQILEMGLPTLVVLNMVDVAAARGRSIDVQRLEECLGVPVVPTAAHRGEGKERLIQQMGARPPVPRFTLPLPQKWEQAVEAVTAVLEMEKENLPFAVSRRWIAAMWLEGNPAIIDIIRPRLSPAAATRLDRLRELYSEAPEEIRRARYEWAARTAAEVTRAATAEKGPRDTSGPVHAAGGSRARWDWSDRLDDILLHRYAGIPIFLAVMALLFEATFNWLGTPLSDFLDGWFSGTLTKAVEEILVAAGSPPWFTALMTEGVIGGVGAVLVFVPQIAVLFFGLSFLEDSGYMARAAVLMDRVMRAAGLGGRSFIPMVLGFGCNVPAIMATRTLEDPRTRLISILVIPFMSCSARLSVYALLVPAFFGQWQGQIVFLLYLTGVLMGAVTARWLGKSLGTGESLFLMELPPYHLPTFKNLALHTWDKVKGFVRKAGTIIFSVSVLLWFLGHFSWRGEVPISESFLASLGGWIAPLFDPMGFGSWQAGVALLTGFLAKELVVATMGIAYGAGDAENSLAALLHAAFTPATALAFLFFVLLYTPCLSTVAMIKRETGSWKWAGFSVVYSASVAWIVAWAVYQVARRML
ncbi:MAG: ferrous iron transport protein B [Alicyclobacillaceae bacterium]|nr:ferrous iron transport protein B [Alicyclobacillaceae bacterium]